MHEQWARVVQKLEAELGDVARRAKLRRFGLRETQSGRWILLAPDPFAQAMVQARLVEPIRVALAELQGAPVDLRVEVRAPQRKKAPSGERARKMARSADTREQLWQDAGNRQAVLAARRFVEQPGELNPLCLFGPASSGKSHLLAWIDGNLFCSGRKVTRLDPGKMFAMVGLSRRDRRRSPLLELADTAEAAIIDLAHQLAGKKETQRELAHVLKRWLERGIPIVIASRLHPKSIQGLDPVVAAILVSGFLVQLPAMSSELRARILQQRLLKGGRQVAHERLQWLAENVSGSIEEQLAVAEQWLGQGGQPDLSGLTIEPRTPDRVITWISKRFGVSTRQIYSCSKARSTRLPRRLAMYWLNDRMRLDVDELAQLFGFRNRRSVRDHVSWVKDAIGNDPDIARWVLDMERELEGPASGEREFGT